MDLGAEISNFVFIFWDMLHRSLLLKMTAEHSFDFIVVFLQLFVEGVDFFGPSLGLLIQVILLICTKLGKLKLFVFLESEGSFEYFFLGLQDLFLEFFCPFGQYSQNG